MALRLSHDPMLPRLLSGAACVLALTGSLMLLAVPAPRAFDEQGHASEALAWIAAVHLAQDQWHIEHGEFQWDLAGLPGAPAPPSGFRVAGPRSTDWESRWEVRLVREGVSTKGTWSVVGDQDGYDPYRSSLPGDVGRGR